MTCAPLVPHRDNHHTSQYLPFITPNLAQLAQLELRAGDVAAAQRLFAQHVEANPTDGRAWLKWAKTEADDAALRILRRAVTAVPQDAYLWHVLAGVVKRVQGRKEGRDVFKLGLENCPTSSALWSGWGTLECEAGNFETAVKFFKKAVDADPNDAFIYMIWAQTEIKRGNMRAAVEIFENGVRQVPKKRASVLYSGYAKLEMQRGRVDKARFLYMRAAEVDPKNALNWQAWACTEERAGHIERARELFERGVLADARFAGNWHAWGIMEMRVGNLDAARCLFEKGTRTSGGDMGCWQAWASLESGEGNVVEARRLYDQARGRMGTESRAATLYLRWAKLEGDCGNVERARELYKEGAGRTNEKAQDVGKLFHSWAGMEKRQGRVEEARKLYKKALRMNEVDVKSMHALAQLELDAERYDLARQLLRKGVKLEPTDTVAVRALASLEWKHFGAVDYARSLFRKTAEKVQNDPGLIRFWAALEENEGDDELAVRLKAFANKRRRQTY